MKVYESFGTFDDVKKEFNLAVQTTNIGYDLYDITGYYDISDAGRYAIVAILETKLGNDTDLSNSKPNSAYIDTDVFTKVDQTYRTGINDRDINKVTKGDEIEVIVHHAIDFNPKNNVEDDQVINDYKSNAPTLRARGSKPGVGGRGIMR